MKLTWIKRSLRRCRETKLVMLVVFQRNRQRLGNQSRRLVRTSILKTLITTLELISPITREVSGNSSKHQVKMQLETKRNVSLRMVALFICTSTQVMVSFHLLTHRKLQLV
jgi:hypothetical protein